VLRIAAQCAPIDISTPLGWLVVATVCLYLSSTFTHALMTVTGAGLELGVGFRVGLGLGVGAGRWTASGRQLVPHSFPRYPRLFARLMVRVRVVLRHSLAPAPASPSPPPHPHPHTHNPPPNHVQVLRSYIDRYVSNISLDKLSLWGGDLVRP
jgi:hypothetical protein